MISKIRDFTVHRFDSQPKRQSKLKRSEWKRKPSNKKKTVQAKRRQQRKPIKAKADPKLVKWGREVKKRDVNKCQWSSFGPCATGDSRIDPHHIAPRGRRPDLKYVPENGISLCRTHHDWCHDNPVAAEKFGLLSSETYEKSMKH